ncbi:MAG: hypothetical protein Q4F65_05820 [Propionibacteriaceae bacterium]|nr:hypothetical protein [Propionibacteriaceae bacterium]
MPDTITIKTTGGDIHISPEPGKPVTEQAIKIADQIDGWGGWLNLKVDRGHALVWSGSVVGIIARRAGRSTSA